MNYYEGDSIPPVGCRPVEHCLVMENGSMMGTLWGHNIIYDGNIVSGASEADTNPAYRSSIFDQQDGGPWVGNRNGP